MGRRLSQASISSGLQPPYVPGRLYPCQGLQGGGVSIRAGLLSTPMRIRPGRWSVVGLWAAAGWPESPVSIRLGLYADDAGRPGLLLRDAGVVASGARGVAKAAFPALVLDAYAGMNLHVVAVVPNTAGGVQAPGVWTTLNSTLGTANAGDPDWAAEYGFDRDLAPDFNANTHQPSLPQGLYVAGVSSAAALADAPNLAAGVHVGGLYGGLIFG